MRRDVSTAEDLFFIGPGHQKTLLAELAGSKAANLAQMARFGLRVPPAFILSTRLCSPINDQASTVEKVLENMLSEGIAYLESVTGKSFGDRRRPLFVSVRSGAARSMPGMMATLLDVGLNHDTVRGLIRMSGNPRLAWDCYRRFVQGYAEVVSGMEARPFEDLLKAFLTTEEATNEAELDPEALERLTSEF